MKLKNFTPHNVVIVIDNTKKIVIPSDGIARVTETKTVTPSIDVDGVIIETFTSAFGELQSLFTWIFYLFSLFARYLDS